MRKIAILVVAVLMVVASAAWGTVVFFPKAASSYDCSSGTSDFDNTANHASGSALDSNGANGGSFQVTTNGKLYSISIVTNGGSCTSNTFKLRWGTSTDLESAYIEEVSGVTGKDGYGKVEFIMTGNDDIASGTTYYLSVQPTDETDTGCYWLYDTGNNNQPYAGTAYKGNSAGSFDITGDSVAGSAQAIEVKLCN